MPQRTASDQNSASIFLSLAGSRVVQIVELPLPVLRADLLVALEKIPWRFDRNGTGLPAVAIDAQVLHGFENLLPAA